MQQRLETFAKGFRLYVPRFEQKVKNPMIPFRVSPRPLTLSRSQKDEIRAIGKDVAGFFAAVNELYHNDEVVRFLLNRGKPTVLHDAEPMNYLFLRPDLLLTPTGFSICEIETSPFGLGLSEVLNRAYWSAGFKTMVGEEVLADYLQKHLPRQGEIVFTSQTEAFSDQLRYLAANVLSGEGRQWTVTQAKDVLSPNLYRAFYLSEYLTDEVIKTLVEKHIEGKTPVFFPSLTPHVEEKAVLGVFWDKRWVNYFQRQLGRAAHDHLSTVIPKTWIVGQERYFIPGLPNGIEDSLALASLTASQRRYVLKPSGFSHQASWAQGVVFMQKNSRDNNLRILTEATQNDALTYVVQEYVQGEKVNLDFETDDGRLARMQAKIRITPYFSPDGTLLSIKATGCEKTDYIHAGTESINTAVM